MNSQTIYNLELQGSTDGESFLSLFRPSNPMYLGNTIQYFLINVLFKYKYYKPYCYDAEPRNPGLLYMQLYIYSD